jgi:hypothetical protein
VRGVAATLRYRLVLGTYGSAIAISLASLIIGRAICILSGSNGSSWIAAPVGFAALMVICKIAVSLPGHGLTAVAVLGVLLVAALALGLLCDASWPSALDGIAVAIGIGALASLPFITSGRVGILGVSILNDTHWHLILAQGLLDPRIHPFGGYGVGYPLGPHAVAAVFAEGLSSRVDWTLTGELMATPILTGWAALGALEGLPRLRRWLVAGLAGLPYMSAAWYVQSAFKEPILSLLLVGEVLLLARVRADWRQRPQAILVPLGVLVAGVLYDYSYPGLAWPVAIAGCWLVVEVVIGGWWRRPSEVVRGLRAAVPMVAVAALVLVVLVAPDIERIRAFYVANGGTAVGTVGGIQRTGPSSLANLAAPLHVLEGLNIWLWGDFRFPPPDGLTAGLLSGLALAVVALALVAALERGRLAWPAAVLALGLLYLYTRDYQSPYVAAKALTIPAPILMLGAGGLLADRLGRVRWPSWSAAALGVLAVAFFSLSLWSSVLVLKDAQVDPTDHFDQLRALRAVLHDRPTLAMFYDDYVQWELLGVPEQMPQQPPGVPLRPSRPWTYGQPYQFDSFEPSTLDQFDYVITSRTLAQSQPPPNFHQIARSADYEVFRRVGPTPDFHVLPNSDGAPGVTLDCSTRAGRALARRRGFAEVRTPPVYLSLAPLVPSASEQVVLHLAPGRWQLSLPYTSQEAVRVSGGGMHVTLPANLDRPGIVWPVGVLTSSGRPITLTFKMTHPGLLNTQDPITQFFTPQQLIAVPDRPDTRVPLRDACGRYVDWYELG